jgi:hypothetical protein
MIRSTDENMNRMYLQKDLMANLDVAFDLMHHLPVEQRPSQSSLMNRTKVVGSLMATPRPNDKMSILPNLAVPLERDASGRLFGGSPDESWFGAFVLPVSVTNGETVEIRPGRWGIVRWHF